MENNSKKSIEPHAKRQVIHLYKTPIARNIQFGQDCSLQLNFLHRKVTILLYVFVFATINGSINNPFHTIVTRETRNFRNNFVINKTHPLPEKALNKISLQDRQDIF